MKLSKPLLCLALAILIVPAGVLGQETGKPTLTFDLSFSTGNEGWEGDFADYPVGEEQLYQLAWGWRSLPSAVDPIQSPVALNGTEIPHIDAPRLNKGLFLAGNLPGNTLSSAVNPIQSPMVDPARLYKGLYLSGINRSDDLFMFVRTPLAGLRPDTYYAATFSVLIESITPPGLVGVGGAPGESVFIKAGASTVKPRKVTRDGSFYVLNVDKGNQSSEGDNAVVIGDLANPLVDPALPRWHPKLLGCGFSLVQIPALSPSAGSILQT